MNVPDLIALTAAFGPRWPGGPVVQAPDTRPFRKDWRKASAGDLYAAGNRARTFEELLEYDAERKAEKAARREAWKKKCGGGSR